MSFLKRRTKAKQLAAERGWTADMTLEQRNRLSADDWKIYQDAFAATDWDDMPAAHQNRFRAMIERNESVDLLAQTVEGESDRYPQGA